MTTLLMKMLNSNEETTKFNKKNQQNLKRKRQSNNTSSSTSQHCFHLPIIKKMKISHFQSSDQKANRKDIINSNDGVNLLDSLLGHSLLSARSSVLSSTNQFIYRLSRIHPDDNCPLIYCITLAYTMVKKFYKYILSSILTNNVVDNYKKSTTFKTLDSQLRSIFPIIVDKLMENNRKPFTFQNIVHTPIIVNNLNNIDEKRRKLCNHLLVLNHIITKHCPASSVVDDVDNDDIVTTTMDKQEYCDIKVYINNAIQHLKLSSTIAHELKQLSRYTKIDNRYNSGHNLVKIKKNYQDLDVLGKDMITQGLYRQKQILHTFLMDKNANEYYYFQIEESMLPILLSIDRLFVVNDQEQQQQGKSVEQDDTTKKQNTPTSSFPTTSKNVNRNYLILSRTSSSSYVIFKKTAWFYMHSFWLPYYNHKVPIYPIMMKHWIIRTNSLYSDRMRKYNVIYTLLSWVDKNSSRYDKCYIINPNDPRFIVYDHLFFILNRWTDSMSSINTDDDNNNIDDNIDQKYKNIKDNVEISTYGLQRAIQHSYLYPNGPNLLKAIRDFIIIRKQHVININMIHKLYSLFERGTNERCQSLRDQYPQTRTIISILRNKPTITANKKGYIPIICGNIDVKASCYSVAADTKDNVNNKDTIGNGGGDDDSFLKNSTYTTMALYSLCLSSLLTNEEAMELFLSIGTVSEKRFRNDKYKLCYDDDDDDDDNISGEMNKETFKKSFSCDDSIHDNINSDGFYSPIYPNSSPLFISRPVQGIRYRQAYMKSFQDRKNWLAELASIEKIIKTRSSFNNNNHNTLLKGKILNLKTNNENIDTIIDGVNKNINSAVNNDDDDNWSIWNESNIFIDDLYTNDTNCSHGTVIATAIKLFAMIEYCTLLNLTKNNMEDINEPLINGIIPEYNQKLTDMLKSNVIHKNNKNDTIPSFSHDKQQQQHTEQGKQLIDDDKMFMVFTTHHDNTVNKNQSNCINTEKEEEEEQSKLLFEVLCGQLRFRWNNINYHDYERKKETNVHYNGAICLKTMKIKKKRYYVL